MTPKIRTSVKDIRKQLPERGYVTLIQKQLKGGNKAITADKIKNVFCGRTVSEKDFLAIIDASKLAVREVKNKERVTLRRITA